MLNNLHFIQSQLFQSRIIQLNTKKLAGFVYERKKKHNIRTPNNQHTHAHIHKRKNEHKPLLVSATFDGEGIAAITLDVLELPPAADSFITADDVCVCNKFLNNTPLEQCSALSQHENNYLVHTNFINFFDKFLLIFSFFCVFCFSHAISQQQKKTFPF